MRAVTIALSIALIVAASASLLFFYQYTLLEARYSTLLQQVGSLTHTVNILLDYGDGRRVWYNGTLIPIGWSLYNATRRVAEVAATYYPEYDSYFVEGINGVGLSKPTEKASWYWIIWVWDNGGWRLLEVGADKYVPKAGDTFAWVFEDTSNWPPRPPT
ncbi:MAG: DUF4430 domain-containing protein [Nitrososphaerota archaeon]